MKGWVGNRRSPLLAIRCRADGQKVPELLIVDLPCHENGWKQAGDTRRR